MYRVVVALAGIVVGVIGMLLMYTMITDAQFSNLSQLVLMYVNKFPAILIYVFYKSTIIYLYLVPEDWSYMSERINQHLNPLVGNNIRRLRKERGLKATEVIAKLQLENVNVTTGIFSKVENGYNNPTVDMLVALTKIFECDFNEFFKTE